MSQLGTSYDNENVHQRERGHDIQVTEMHSSQTDFDDEYTHTTELRDGNKLRNPHAPFAESVVGKALLVTFIVVAIITLVFTAVRMNSRLQQLHTASTLNFVVIGDWGAYNDPQRLVAARMGEACERAIPPCAFVISVGDNFYPDGVTSTTDTKFKDVFEEVYTHSSLQKRWYMALGNHDYRGNPQAQVDYTLMSDRWYLPSRYYAHDQFVGIKGSPHSFNVQFAFMDTNPFVEKYRHDTVYNPAEIIKQNITEQMEWLEDILSGEYQGSGESDISDDPQESTHRTWKIMIGHHPVYSAASHGDTEEMKNMVKPMLEKYHVHAMFAGHDHNLQHIEELPNSVPFEVEYFVSGSGSKQRDDKHAMPYRLRNFTSDYGFLFVSIEEDKMTVNFINSEGKTVYTSVTDYRP